MQDGVERGGGKTRKDLGAKTWSKDLAERHMERSHACSLALDLHQGPGGRRGDTSERDLCGS